MSRIFRILATMLGHIISNGIYFSVKLRNKPPAPIVEFEIPYLGAEDVIDEVITLLAKLENDRRDTKRTFKKKRKEWTRYLLKLTIYQNRGCKHYLLRFKAVGIQYVNG